MRQIALFAQLSSSQVLEAFQRLNDAGTGIGASLLDSNKSNRTRSSEI